MQFIDVVGHNELKKRLIHEVNQNRISHAQLFLGKMGYGGLPMALAFIQYLFCKDKKPDDSCAVCDNCRRISAAQHPDVHFTFPAVQALGKLSNNFLPQWRDQIVENPYFDIHDWVSRIDDKERKPIIGAEESLEIIKKMNLKSFEGGYKVYIIWMAEEMNAFSGNKLLKIIEEPPPNSLFILLAENIEMVLPTILSRTQTIKIPRLSNEDVISFLTKKHGINSLEASNLATRSEGNIVKVRGLFEALDYQNNHRESFIKLMRCCYKKDVLSMLDWSDEASTAGKEQLKIFLLYSLEMCRQSILKNYVGEHMNNVSQEEKAFLDNFSRFVTGNNINLFLNLFSEAHYHIDRNANTKIELTFLCFQIMRFIHAA
jgi:DNA polymerase-3 subunit delta'